MGERTYTYVKYRHYYNLLIYSNKNEKLTFLLFMKIFSLWFARKSSAVFCFAKMLSAFLLLKLQFVLLFVWLFGGSLYTDWIQYRLSSQANNSPTGYTNIRITPMTLTLTRWPWYMNLTYIFQRCICSHYPKYGRASRSHVLRKYVWSGHCSGQLLHVEVRDGSFTRQKINRLKLLRCGATEEYWESRG